LLLAATAAAGLRADEAGALRVLARVQSFYRDTPGITAQFVQTLDAKALGRPQEESGTVWLKPPGRMRWEYRKPAGKIAVLDGRHAYLYLPEDRQVVIGKMGDLEAGAVTTRLLLGSSPIAADFRVEGEPSPSRPGAWLLKLSPKAADFPYDSVGLEVEEATGVIRSIKLVDPLGNRMEYRFENVQPVRNLSDRLFTYKIPRGVDIQTMGDEAIPGFPSP
jgi:outer membrane lipoprotein carrier protein